MYRAEAKRCGAPEGPRSYSRGLEHAPLLSAEEGRERAAAIARGEREAQARLVAADLRLVVHSARRYAGRGLALDDLIGEGNPGLLRAAQRYDTRFGTRFGTYASLWIKQAVPPAIRRDLRTRRRGGPAHRTGSTGGPPPAWPATPSLCPPRPPARSVPLPEPSRSATLPTRAPSHDRLDSSGDDRHGGPAR